MKKTNSSEQTRPEAVDLETFLRQHHDHAHRFLCHRFPVLRDEDVDDIVQEASIALWENITRGHLQTLTTSLLNYYLSICHRQALYRLRQSQRTQPLTIDLDRSQVPPLEDEATIQDSRVQELALLVEDTPSDTEAYHRQLDEVEERIRQAVLGMPEPCNHLLWGQYWDHLSHSTMAAMYGYRSAAVSKTTASRCKDKFARYLKQLNLSL